MLQSHTSTLNSCINNESHRLELGLDLLGSSDDVLGALEEMFEADLIHLFDVLFVVLLRDEEDLEIILQIGLHSLYALLDLLGHQLNFGAVDILEKDGVLIG